MSKDVPGYCSRQKIFPSCQFETDVRNPLKQAHGYCGDRFSAENALRAPPGLAAAISWPGRY
ncbi:MAG: hypothetical protein KBD67_03220 [Anaerolineaceae bacterium]|nr:hypothetical protein [Anaerolineaceae bacterium]